MSYEKLKKIFILCLIVLVILIIVSSCNVKRNTYVEDGDKSSGISIDININEARKFENLDYNNLSQEEMDYISDKYSNNVRFTKDGVEVYNESIFSGKIRKIITSTWPNTDIANIIPNPEFGKLDKIEYNKDWIIVYINEANKSDVKDYLKQLNEYGFLKNETKDDGNVMLKYDIYNENGDLVTVKFIKGTKQIEIKAEKNKN